MERNCELPQAAPTFKPAPRVCFHSIKYLRISTPRQPRGIKSALCIKSTINNTTKKLWPEENMTNPRGRAYTKSILVLACYFARGWLSAFPRPLVATLFAAFGFFFSEAGIAQQQAAPFEVPRTGTLKKINDSGVMRLGYRENSPPF